MRLLRLFSVILAPLVTQTVAYAAPVTPSAAPVGTTVAAPTTSPAAVRHAVGKRAWWMTLSRAEKLKVVEGAIDGLVNGWWRAFTDYDTKVQVVIIKTDVKGTDSKTWLKVDKELGSLHEQQAREEPTFSKKLGSYIDGIDQFYATNPRAENVTVGEVLQCLSDKPWKSCAEVAKIFS